MVEKLNVEVMCINNDLEFKELYPEILEFSKRCITETFEEERDTSRDLSQTHKNMAWENWENNNECLLYRIYKAKKFSNGNGMYTFLKYNNQIIASSGVELLNDRVANMGKRSFVFKKYRTNAIINANSFPKQFEWVLQHNREVKDKVDIVLLTFNEYNKHAVFKTIKKFISKEYDGEWNFMHGWKVYPGKAIIHGANQYFVYTILNENIDIDDSKLIKMIIET